MGDLDLSIETFQLISQLLCKGHVKRFKMMRGSTQCVPRCRIRLRSRVSRE
jgi:hypothetical protein